MNFYTPITVSLFDNLHSSQPKIMTLREVFDLVRSDEGLKRNTYYHRNGEPQKLNTPVVVPSAVMAGGRKTGNIQRLSGAMYFDFDHLSPELKSELIFLCAHNIHCIGHYTSIGGEGLHIFVRYEVFYYDNQPLKPEELDFTNPATSPRAKLLWNAIWEDVRHQFEDYIRTATQQDIHVDAQCKDPARSSILAYDSNSCYYEGASIPYTVYLSQAMLDYGGSRAHRVTGNPVGRPAKNNVCRSFDAAEAFAVSKGLEKKHGSLNKYVSQVIYEVNRYGIDRNDALEEAKSRFYYYGDGEKGISSIVNSVYNNNVSEFGTRRLPGRERNGEQKIRRATSADIEEFLLRQGEFRKNVINHHLEVKWNEESQMDLYKQREQAAYSLRNDEEEPTTQFQDLADPDVQTLMRLLYDETGLTVFSKNELYDVLWSNTCSTTYNPIIEYLRPLQGKWKPGDPDYLLALSQTIEVEGGEESRRMLDDYFARWFVGMVHGWINMKSTHGTILALIGPQGIGKSSWMRMLMPPELRGYYKEQMMLRALDKDDRIQLASNGLINLEEIDAMSEADVNRLKALVTLASIQERLPYAKAPVSLPRIATFCATGNRMDFLTDQTGNRRWLAFTVKRFTIDPFEYMPDYEHIFAQALYLAQYQADTFVMSQNDIHELEKHNEAYMSQSVEAEMCATYVHHGVVDINNQPVGDSKWMPAVDIMSRLNYFNPTVRLSIRGLALAMRKQGIENRVSRGIRQYLVTIY